MSEKLQFAYEGLQVSVSYDSSTNSVSRRVSDTGVTLYQDELPFDKSLVASFDLMSAEDQANLVNNWGAAGLKTRIDDGQFDSPK